MPNMARPVEIQRCLKEFVFCEERQCNQYPSRAEFKQRWDTNQLTAERSLSRRAAGSLGGEEQIVGGVWRTDFLADVRSVAAGGGCFASFGVEALDGCGAGEHAAAFVGDDVDQEPGNGIWVGRRCVRDGFAGDTAAIAGFPRRPGEMFAEGLSVVVEELRVGGFQRPCELRGVGLADVDLITFRVN